MTERKKDTRFKPGQSGNPGGRPSAGLGKNRADLVTAWEGEPGTQGIREKLLEMARGGDMAAIRLVAERVCAPVKATEQPTPISLGEGTLSEQGRAVFQALGTGDLAPGQAAQLLQALGGLAKVIETDELARRIEALEAKGK
jgi:hypothetical protein